MGHGRAWSKDDDELLLTSYRKLSKSQLAKKLGRSEHSVLCRAYKLGMHGSLEEHNIQQMPYRDWETDRKSTRLNSSHSAKSRMPSSA